MVTTRKVRAAKGPVGRPAKDGPSSRTVFSLSEEETFELGRGMGRTLRAGQLILLEGDLGLGKTVFVRGVAAGLGVPPEEVSSPSYALVHEYRDGRFPLFHLDLYRLDENNDDISGLGFEDLLAGGGVVLVEWGDKLPPYLRRGALTIRFHDVGEGSRRIEIVVEPDRPPRPRGDA